MESFNANLQGGKKLVKSLEKQSVRAPPRMHACMHHAAASPARRLERATESVHVRASQPVSCLQAPSTPAIVAPGDGGGPGIAVGTNASTQQRVIMPVAD